MLLELTPFAMVLFCLIILFAGIFVLVVSRRRQNHVWRFMKRLPLFTSLVKLSGKSRQSREAREQSRWLNEIRALLAPVSMARVELSRLGNPGGDGGYLIADDGLEFDVLVSYGILDDVSFELDFVRRYPNTQVHLFDHTIERLPEENPSFTFHRQGLGPGKTDQLDSLQSHLQAFATHARCIFLKIDVEGAEYESLLATPQRAFDRVQQIAIELHNVCWTNKHIIPLLQRLSRDFQVVHVHGNNSGGVLSVAGVAVPMVLEVTFLRRNSHRILSPPPTLPHPLDRPNDPTKGDIKLEFLSM